MTWLIDFITERPVMFARYVCYIVLGVVAVMGFLFKKKAKKMLYYDGFEKWLNEQISKCCLDDVIAFNFNLYEDGGKKWSVELVGTDTFSEGDTDWACCEVFATRDNPFVVEHSGDFREVLSVFKSCVVRYLECGNYREQLKSKAGIGIGFVDGDLELLHKNTDFKTPKSTSCFPYAQPMDADMMMEVVQTSTAANNNFKFTNRQDQQKIVEQIDKKIAALLNGKPFPVAYEDIEDVAVALGARYGYAFNQARKWKWMMVGTNKETAQVCIVSPKRNYCIFPLTYMLGILKGEKENNALLLWNMTENIDENPINKDDKELTPLS